jgi:hypothetical protein
MSHAQQALETEGRRSSPASARTTCQELLNVKKATELMLKTADHGWISWAPDSHEKVTRITHGFRNYLQKVSNPELLSLQMLVHLQPMIG